MIQSFLDKPDTIKWIRERINCSLPEANKLYDFIGRLTKLDHFAGQAMQGLLSSLDYNEEWESTIVAKNSIVQAKELIKQLEAEK